MTTHGNAGPNYCERRVHERAGGRIDSDRQPRVLDRRLGGRADGRAGGRDCQWAAGNPGRRAMTPANVGARCRANGRTRTGQWTPGKRTTVGGRQAGWTGRRAGGGTSVRVVVRGRRPVGGGPRAGGLVRRICSGRPLKTGRCIVCPTAGPCILTKMVHQHIRIFKGITKKWKFFWCCKFIYSR